MGVLQRGALVLKQRSQSHELGREQLYGTLFWHLYQDRHFKRFMLEHARLFWVEIEWKDKINYRLVPENHELYNYNRTSDIADLLRHTPARGWIGKLKRLLRIYLADTAWLNSVVFRINRFLGQLARLGLDVVRHR